jgi:endo-1,3-1,4-beta-glycanase ExoK
MFRVVESLTDAASVDRTPGVPVWLRLSTLLVFPLLSLLGCAANPAAPAGTGTGGADGSAATGDADAGGDGSAASDAAADDDASADAFVLAWQDDFDTLDTTKWQLQTFTFAGNAAQFTPDNAAVANGILTLNLTPNPASTAEPYWGVEMRSAKTLTYGKVSARMRFATGSGVVSGLVLFYTPYPNCNWNEIDIEHLGKTSNSSQLNAQVFLGKPDPSCTTSVSPSQDPQVVDLGVNAETDFHQYDIEWTPAGVSTYVDGRLLRTWTKHADLLNLPETILFTIWASSAASWAGPLTSTSAPTSADVDWIKVYQWSGSTPAGG